jgi:hypothetical protein
MEEIIKGVGSSMIAQLIVLLLMVPFPAIVMIPENRLAAERPGRLYSRRE